MGIYRGGRSDIVMVANLYYELNKQLLVFNVK